VYRQTNGTNEGPKCVLQFSQLSTTNDDAMVQYDDDV